MSKRLVLTAAAAVAALLPMAAPAAASGFCYDVSVVVNGDAVIAEAGCQDLP